MANREKKLVKFNTFKNIHETGKVIFFFLIGILR